MSDRGPNPEFGNVVSSSCNLTAIRGNGRSRRFDPWISVRGPHSLVLIEDLDGHRETNNFVGFPTRGQIYRLQ